VSADIYKPELWNSFFIMVGGGVAALTGLVFVALSIALSLKLEDMTEDATHKYRSINTLAGLTAIFITCGLVLMPNQTHREIGAELLILSVIGAAIFLYGFRQAFKFGSQPSKQRLLIGSGLYVAEAVGALVLLSGSISGLYVAAISLVVNVAFMISAAWLLVVSVYSARMRHRPPRRPGVRDARPAVAAPTGAGTATVSCESTARSRGRRVHSVPVVDDAVGESPGFEQPQ
jgi:hypothetical protein